MHEESNPGRVQRLRDIQPFGHGSFAWNGRMAYIYEYFSQFGGCPSRHERGQSREKSIARTAKKTKTTFLVRPAGVMVVLHVYNGHRPRPLEVPPMVHRLRRLVTTVVVPPPCGG